MSKISNIFSIFVKDNTEAMVTSVLDYEKLRRKTKKLIIVFGTSKCEVCQKILSKYSSISSKAEDNGYVIRFCDIKKHKNFKNIWIKSIPTLKYYKKGKKIDTLTDEKEIYTYLRNTKNIWK